VIFRHEVLRVPRRRDGDAELFGDCQEAIVFAADADAGAGQDHRALGRANGRDGLPRGFVKRVASQPAVLGGQGEVAAIAFAPRIEAVQVGGIDQSGLDVDRHVQPHWPRPAGLCEPQRLFEQIAHVQRIGDHRREFGDRLHHRNDVDFLIAQLAQANRGVAGQRLALHLA
jgi:hypothetical protein